MRRGQQLAIEPLSSVRGLHNDLSEKKKRLLEIIEEKSLLKGQFKLASGAASAYYIDLKKTMFDPEGSALLAEVVFDLVKNDRDVDSIGGLELGAVPIVSTVCSRSAGDRPINAFVVRKEKKGHGTDNRIDGNFKPNSTVVLIDDVTTTGGSVMQAVRAIRERGGTIKKVVTIVDRLEGARANLKKEGLELIALFTPDDFAPGPSPK